MKHLAFALAALAVVGCSSGTQPPPPPTAKIDAAKSTVVVDPAGPLHCDGTMAIVTVTVNDTDGKPMQSVPVALSLSGDGGQLTDASPTDKNGVSTARVLSTLAETKTLTAAVGDPPVVLDQKPTIVWLPGPPAGVLFAVQPPATVKAGELITPAVQLSVVDQYGNVSPDPPVGAQLRLVYSNAGVVSGGAVKQSVDGGITFDMLSINRVQVGYALRAEVMSGPAAGAADESRKFDVVTGDVSMATSTLIASPVNVVADGVATTTLTVTLNDLGVNPVAGQAVALTVSGTGNTLGASSGTSDGTGTFSTTLSSTVAEMKTVTATVGTVQLTTPVTFIP